MTYAKEFLETYRNAKKNKLGVFARDNKWSVIKNMVAIAHVADSRNWSGRIYYLFPDNSVVELIECYPNRHQYIAIEDGMWIRESLEEQRRGEIDLSLKFDTLM